MLDEEFKAMNKKMLDLTDLSFEQGNRVMSNENCKLPQDSFKLTKKGYEEIHVPAKINSAKNIKKIKLDELPKWVQPIFAADKNFQALNPIQSAVFNTAFKSSENMLVCAPTGAGKTNIALLTIL